MEIAAKAGIQQLGIPRCLRGNFGQAGKPSKQLVQAIKVEA
jgi:hypothetical protein